MKVTYYGQGCIYLEMNNTKLLFDPFITHNPKNTSIDINTITTDYIFLTHGHEDHTADVVNVVKHNPNACLVSNFEIIQWYQKQGFQIKMHSMNIGGKHTFDFGTVKCVNAVHSSSMPDGTYAGNPMGFVVYDDNSCVYIAGDTAVTEDMKLIPKLCPKLDIAILPVGDNYTMGVEDAIIASEYVDCSRILACHYDTFPIIEIDKKSDAVEYFSKHGKQLVFSDIGESIDI